MIRLTVAVVLAALCACAAPDPSAPPCRAAHEAYAAAQQAQDAAKEALAAISLASDAYTEAADRLAAASYHAQASAHAAARAQAAAVETAALSAQDAALAALEAHTRAFAESENVIDQLIKGQLKPPPGPLARASFIALKATNQAYIVAQIRTAEACATLARCHNLPKAEACEDGQFRR